MKKGIITLMIFLVFIVIPIKYTYCETTDETLKSQQNEFKI